MPAMQAVGGIKAGESIRLKARRGKIPIGLFNPLFIGERKVPPGLSAYVKATLWEKPGDHPAVKSAPAGVMHADQGAIVTVQNGVVELYRGKPAIASPERGDGTGPAPEGTKFKQLRPVDGIVSVEGEDGYTYDHVVMPGFYVIENEVDGVVWALSPWHVRAWFEPVK